MATNNSVNNTLSSQTGTGHFVGSIEPTLTGPVAVDNITLTGNTIESTNTNGNLDINTNGTGQVVINASTGITEVLNDGTMAADSPTALATQASIVTYVKSQVAAASGAWVYISSATASNSATIEFTGLTNSYVAYQVYFYNVTPESVSGNPIFSLRTSANGLTWDSGASDYFSFDVSSSSVPFTEELVSTSSNYGSSGYAFLQNVGTAIYHPILVECSYYYYDSAFSANVWIGGGPSSTLRVAAAVIEGVQFFMSSGNMASGTFYLFGLQT